MIGELRSLATEHVFQVGMRGAAGLSAISKIAAILRDNKIEILHAHLARDYPIAALVSARTGTPFILTRTRSFSDEEYQPAFVAPGGGCYCRLKRRCGRYEKAGHLPCAEDRDDPQWRGHREICLRKEPFKTRFTDGRNDRRDLTYQRPKQTLCGRPPLLPANGAMFTLSWLVKTARPTVVIVASWRAS
jgi:hypothetical protein